MGERMSKNMCNKLIKNFIINFRKRDETAFKTIYQVFEKLIKLYASRIYYEDGRAELDLFLIELLNNINLSRFDSRADSFTIQKYIAVSIRNKYLYILQKSIEHTRKIYPLFELSDNAEEFFYEKLMLPDAFDLLSEKQKTVIKNKYIYGYSDSEICKMMGTTRQAVNGIKRRAVETLKEFYEK